MTGPTADLIERLEKATAQDHTYVIRDALRFALYRGWITADAYKRAYEMCNAGAFLDAALTLVPDGMYWVVGLGKLNTDEKPYGAIILTPLPNSREIAAVDHHASAALALTIAALKAKESTNDRVAPRLSGDSCNQRRTLPPDTKNV